MFSSSDFSLGRGRNTSSTAVLLSSEEFFGRHGDLNGLSSCETQSTPDQRNESCSLSHDLYAGHHIGSRPGRVMRHLSKRRVGTARRYSPKGLAFEIADLVLIRSWADLHDCRMLIRLDHGPDGEEYEEVIALYTETGSQCHLIMWRNVAAVFLQPLIGQKQRYRSVAKALESLDLKPRIVLTDITASSWPSN